MAFTLPTGITHGSKSRVNHASIHPRLDAVHNDYNARDYRRNRNRNIWRSLQQMGWREYPTFISKFWRNSRYRFSLYSPHSWRSIYVRNNNKSSRSGTNNRYHKRNRYYCYYYLLISLLAIGLPVKAEDEINNTSNPVAAATGNVTNQAVQFQNNGAPSRQNYGGGINCSGPTMTFSPFYMGNHVKPWDEDMNSQGYTMTENWGMQLNFMVPLDGSIVERCKSIAKRQEQKMRLDYELVRFKECASLMQKGFMIKPGTPFAHLCGDLMAISTYKEIEARILAEKNACKPNEEFKFPWQKKTPKCQLLKPKK